jgi:glycerol-3-phosphate dehydrogenase
VARDLALRGVRVMLLEKDDYGAGTSGGSSWMIHGGPRYLEFDWRTTRLSCEDAGRIVKIARHMVHRVVFLLPVLPGDRHGMERLETALEVYDRFQPLKFSHPHVRLTAPDARRLEPGLATRIEGAMTMEEWGVDPHRLSFANVQDAVRAGAVTCNHTRVIGLLRDGRRVIGVRHERPDGVRQDVRARLVVNAAGPWVPELCAMAGVQVWLRPAKGVHLLYGRRLANFAISAEAIDGRDLLLVPHGPFTLLGTTDDDFYGDLDSVEVLPDEVEYLLQAFDRLLPGIRDYHPLRVTTGVRPTLYRWRPYEDDLSRRYQVFDHETRDGVPGLLTVAGGKLSMYRLMAEDTADLVCSKLGVAVTGTTADQPLPGADDDIEDAAEVARRFDVSALVAGALLARHGSRVRSVLEGPVGRRVVCRCASVTEGELVHAARHEQVTGIGDAMRRVGAASGPCLGGACLVQVAGVVGRELGWSPSQRREAAHDFVAGIWPGRAPALDPIGWAQEEMNYRMRRATALAAEPLGLP